MADDFFRVVRCAISMLGLTLAGCGGGGGGGGGGAPITPPGENRIDVVVVGLPAGVSGAVTITDAAGRTIFGGLTNAGQVQVAGPGTFTVNADPVLVGGDTYTATVVPATITCPRRPPSAR